MRTVALSFLLVLLTATSVSAGKCGGAKTCQCGDKVTSDYVMSADLGPCKKNGLRLGSNVTLDGNGHTISGLWQGQKKKYGVYLKGTKGGIVKNIVVTGFRHGVRLRKARNSQVLNMTLFQNGNFATSVGYGIDIAKGSRDNLIQSNVIIENADEGVHFGSGSSNNTFDGNEVYDNFRENMYLFSSDHNVLTNNTTWLGTNSLFVKDSSFNVIDQNTFRDASVLIRGDSHDNSLMDNTLSETGIHFQVFPTSTLFLHPHDNMLSGGMIRGKLGDSTKCIRFSSSWNNVITDTVLSFCEVDIVSDGSLAESRNSFIGATFDEVQLDNNSYLEVGWHLDVHVQDSQENPLGGAHVKAWDVFGTEIFAVLTNAAGDIDAQDVLAYIEGPSGQTLHTPLTLETSKTGYQTDTRQLSFSANTATTIELQKPL